MLKKHRKLVMRLPNKRPDLTKQRLRENFKFNTRNVKLPVNWLA